MQRQAQDRGAPGSLRGKALPTAQEGGWDGPRFPSISSIRILCVVGWEAAELGSVKVKASSEKLRTMIRKIDVTQDIQVMSITFWLPQQGGTGKVAVLMKCLLAFPPKAVTAPREEEEENQSGNGLRRAATCSTASRWEEPSKPLL